jgi:hypothetical protein
MNLFVRFGFHELGVRNEAVVVLVVFAEEGVDEF